MERQCGDLRLLQFRLFPSTSEVVVDAGDWPETAAFRNLRAADCATMHAIPVNQIFVGTKPSSETDRASERVDDDSPDLENRKCNATDGALPLLDG